MANKQNPKAVSVLTVLTTICSMVGLYLYCNFGTNKLCPDILVPCVAALIAASALGLLLTVLSIANKQVLLLRYVLYLAALAAFAEYIVSQLNYIANVLYGVDGNHFTAAMLATLAVLLVGWISGLAAAVIQRKTVYRWDLSAKED